MGAQEEPLRASRISRTVFLWWGLHVEGREEEVRRAVGHVVDVHSMGAGLSGIGEGALDERVDVDYCFGFKGIVVACFCNGPVEFFEEIGGHLQALLFQAGRLIEHSFAGCHDADMICSQNREKNGSISCNVRCFGNGGGRVI